MSQTITVTVDDSAIKAAFSKLAGTAQNMKPALSEIGNVLKESARLRIATDKASPEGIPWKPWAKSTAKQRARSGKGELMRFNSILLNSITTRVSADSVEVGTNVPYAAIHQFGGDIQQNPHSRLASARRKRTAKGNWSKKKISVKAHERGAYSIHIPARPFLGVSGADRNEIVSILTRAFTRAGS